MAKTTHRASLMSDAGSQYLLPMFALLRSRYATQAVRPTHHWWQCPRGLAWFQVLMVWSLVKPSACAEPLSRRGDYLRAARGPGLLLQIKKRTAFPHERAPTRGPPDPLFHRSRPMYASFFKIRATTERCHTPTPYRLTCP